MDNLQSAPNELEDIPMQDESGLQEFDAVKAFDDAMSRCSYARQEYDRNTYRNVLFYIGKQWISFNTGKRFWVNTDLPSWIPKPVTNKFASSADTAMSVLDNVKPTILYTPAQDTSEALGASRAANSIIDICNEEVELPKRQIPAKFWSIIAGDVFLFPTYKTKKEYGTMKIQNLICSACGYSGGAENFKDDVCPQCGQSGQNAKAFDENGQPIYTEYPMGKMEMEVCGPLQVYADLETENIEDSSFVFKAKSYSQDQMRENFPEAVMLDSDFTGTSQDYLAQQYLQNIAFTTNATSAELTSAGPSARLRCTVFECFFKPTPKLPKGAYFVMANHKILEGPMPLPFKDDSGRHFVNVIHIKSKAIPNRLLSKSPVDDLIFKQVQRNKLEMFIELSQSRMGNATWLIPSSCGIKEITGEPGEKIFYNDATTLNAKPEKVPGVEITQSTFRYLQIIDRDFEEIGATTDVLKGQAPKNVPTLGALELLQERGLSRFGPLIASWEEAHVKLSRMFLWIWKQYATEPRTKRSLGPDGNWQYEQFNNASLTGAVDVIAEKGSASPRSEAYKQSIAGQFVDKKLIDINDPMVKLELFRMFHAENLCEDLENDIQDALKEQEAFRSKGEIGLRLRPAIDNNYLHYQMHKKYAKSEDFMALPQGLKEIFYRHIEATLMVLKQGQQPQQQQPGESPAQGGQLGGVPPTRTPVAGKQLSELVQSIK